MWNLIRWVSARTIKETFVPPTDYRYPFMDPDGGGAANIGFATSRDAGRTWRRGFLPGLSVNSSPAGDFPIVSDPSIAYDAIHGTWLVVTLAVAGDRSAVLVSRSTDGLTWSLPV